MEFLREFGLILFVLTIGLQIGPGFFASLRDEHRSGGRTPALKPVAHRDARKGAVSRMGLKTAAIS